MIRAARPRSPLPQSRVERGTRHMFGQAKSAERVMAGYPETGAA